MPRFRLVKFPISLSTWLISDIRLVLRSRYTYLGPSYTRPTVARTSRPCVAPSTTNVPSPWPTNVGFLRDEIVLSSSSRGRTIVRTPGSTCCSKSTDQTVPLSSQQSKVPSVDQEQETAVRSEWNSIGKSRTVFEQVNTRYTERVPVDGINRATRWAESVEHLSKIEK